MRNLLTAFGLSLALAGLIEVPSDAQTTPVVVPETASCATSVDGMVVGVRNPLLVPVTSVVYSGTLGSGNYFVEQTWYDAAGHETLPGPETQVQLVSTGQIWVQSPAGMPAEAVGSKVYISGSSGTETLQGSVVGSGTYAQSVPLVTGAAPPSTNTTVCALIANDAGWPSGTGYGVELTSPNGSTQPGYPMQWQLLNPGSTYNIGTQGLPLYNGMVTYPIPILARPYNHAIQSISGPLSMTGYKITQVSYLGIGTSVPAWGVDAEVPGGGNPLEGVVNAATGFLINGAAGTSGQAPCSDGTYIDHFCTFVTSIPTIYYQTVKANGSAQTQRAALNFSTRFAVTDSASPAQTTIDLATVGAAGTYASPASLTFDAYGRETAVTASSAVNRVCNSDGCYRIEADGTIEEWGHTSTATGSDTAETLTATFPYAFTTVTHLEPVVAPVGNPTGDGNPTHTPAMWCFRQSRRLVFPRYCRHPSR